MRLNRFISRVLAIVAAAALAACSSVKHVPEGEFLLNSVKISVDDNKPVTPKSLANYIRQQPNHRVLGFAKLSLGIYNMSGRDSAKWYNRWLRSIGQEPVIYDSELAEQSRRQLGLALLNRGYNNATVTIDSIKHPDKKKIDLVYHVAPGEPLVIETIEYQFDDPALGEVIIQDTAAMLIANGTLLNRDLLEQQRADITSRLRDRGYFAFNKDYITYVADTVAGSRGVGLTMRVHAPESKDGATLQHRRYKVDHVTYIIESPNNDENTRPDTITHGGFSFIYGKDRYLRPGILEEKCFIRPGETYSASDVNRTYEALSTLSIVKFVNIVMSPVPGDTAAVLDAFITISRTKKQGVTVELEGTNSEGDLGFGVGLTYQHRDLAHRGEVLTAKFRGSYESLSGNLDGFINNRYTEFAGEVGIAFPKLMVPLLSRDFKRKSRSATEFAVSMNYQERPEYTRVISGLSWKYRWNNPQATWRHTLDLLDLNFVYLPKSTIDFINNVAPHNPLLRYSYEDHLIMRIGYTFYRTNRRNNGNNAARFGAASYQPRIWTLRVSGETAGNILYAISSLAGQKRSDGAYKVFGVQYAQYIKGEVQYTHLINFSRRSAVAFHAGFGIGYPYGNSKMIPFEKRFYAGGANSVRGWGVRTLGPGGYDARNSVIDFINQCGDISLELSAEYRAKLFWVLEGAVFVDAGNIWTIKSYENQPDGLFRFNEFYKQIAMAYGAGLRLDFTYFLIRFDLGMKAHNPALGQEPWPLVHPNWHRDHTFHLSIGYPF